MPSASFSLRRLAIAPTIVTSSPSRIHTVPRPRTTSQCQPLHGRRSIRAGIRVSTVFSLMGRCFPVSAREQTVYGGNMRRLLVVALLAAGCGGGAHRSALTATPTPTPTDERDVPRLSEVGDC